MTSLLSLALSWNPTGVKGGSFTSVTLFSEGKSAESKHRQRHRRQNPDTTSGPDGTVVRSLDGLNIQIQNYLFNLIRFYPEVASRESLINDTTVKPE